MQGLAANAACHGYAQRPDIRSASRLMLCISMARSEKGDKIPMFNRREEAMANLTRAP